MEQHLGWEEWKGRALFSTGSIPPHSLAHACLLTLHSVLSLWSIFQCHSLLMMCIATCVGGGNAVLWCYHLKCFSPPGWYNGIVYRLPEWWSFSSRTSYCSKGWCQHSKKGGFICYIQCWSIYHRISNNSDTLLLRTPHFLEKDANFVLHFICTPINEIFYCSYNKNTSTVWWHFWRPEARVNTFFWSWSWSYSRGCH